MKNNDALFKAFHISDISLTDDELFRFRVRHHEGQGLVSYLQRFAEDDEDKQLMRTYIVKDQYGDELVGYFSLKAGMIAVNEQKNGTVESFDTIPGVELANFAVDSRYTSKHPESRGCGKIIFEKLIIPVIESVSGKIGIRLIYIFSLPIDSLIKRYAQYGFKRLSFKQEKKLHKRLKPNYDKNCIFMYQELVCE